MARKVDSNFIHTIWLADEEGVFIFHDEVNNTFYFSPDKDGTDLITDIPASVIREVSQDILG